MSIALSNVSIHQGFIDAVLPFLGVCCNERFIYRAGTPEPIGDPMLDGRWRLLFTTTPSSASPIQRTFTGVEAFKASRAEHAAPA